MAIEKSVQEPVHVRLMGLAMEMAAMEEPQYLDGYAVALSNLAREVEDNYVQMAPVSENSKDTPTTAQGVALARLLRGVLDGRGNALITGGGTLGLPHRYLAVRFQDGYEAGIAPDGEVST